MACDRQGAYDVTWRPPHPTAGSGRGGNRGAAIVRRVTLVVLLALLSETVCFGLSFTSGTLAHSELKRRRSGRISPCAVAEEPRSIAPRLRTLHAHGFEPRQFQTQTVACAAGSPSIPSSIPGLLRRAATAVASAWASVLPRAAWARQAAKYASRQQEQTAQWVTCGLFAVLFVGAWSNSRKEDRDEDERIRGEVQRLVRLKKEFDEAEPTDMSDTDVGAALQAAKDKLDKKRASETDNGGEELGDSTDDDAPDSAE